MKSAPWLDGWFAHKLGLDVNSNPYNFEFQSYSAYQWNEGYCERFSAKKHGGDLLYDDVE